MFKGTLRILGIGNVIFSSHLLLWYQFIVWQTFESGPILYKRILICVYKYNYQSRCKALKVQWNVLISQSNKSNIADTGTRKSALYGWDYEFTQTLHNSTSHFLIKSVLPNLSNYQQILNPSTCHPVLIPATWMSRWKMQQQWIFKNDRKISTKGLQGTTFIHGGTLYREQKPISAKLP